MSSPQEEQKKTFSDFCRTIINTIPNMRYVVKWSTCSGKEVPIILQKEYGPCPLLAIANALILAGKPLIPRAENDVHTNVLLEFVMKRILNNIPEDLSDEKQVNFNRNFFDAMYLLPKLQTGLDVNVKFSGNADFEYTAECILFDLLHVPLYHVWVVDPNIPEEGSVISRCNYNQLLDKVVNFKTSSNCNTDVKVIETFLEKTATQATPHGITTLKTLLGNGDLCVVFRNNHFSTVVKFGDALFQLVTSQGFHENVISGDVMWQTINDVDGDCQFVDQNFNVVFPTTRNVSNASGDEGDARDGPNFKTDIKFNPGKESVQETRFRLTSKDKAKMVVPSKKTKVVKRKRKTSSQKKRNSRKSKVPANNKSKKPKRAKAVKKTKKPKENKPKRKRNSIATKNKK